jgi:hypothetical protein
MAMPVGHIAGAAALPVYFYSSWLVPSAFLLAVLLHMLPLFVGFRYVQHYQSDYLFNK